MFSERGYVGGYRSYRGYIGVYRGMEKHIETSIGCRCQGLVFILNAVGKGFMA